LANRIDLSGIPAEQGCGPYAITAGMRRQSG
jgi:hypothetical protein